MCIDHRSQIPFIDLILYFLSSFFLKKILTQNNSILIRKSLASISDFFPPPKSDQNVISPYNIITLSDDENQETNQLGIKPFLNAYIHVANKTAGA